MHLNALCKLSFLHPPLHHVVVFPPVATFQTALVTCFVSQLVLLCNACRLNAHLIVHLEVLQFVILHPQMMCWMLASLFLHSLQSLSLFL